MATAEFDFYGPPHIDRPFSDPPAQPLFNPDTKRESYHWATIPEAYRGIPGITDWANDPSSDPNVKVQDYLSKMRQSNPRTDMGDAEALRGLSGAQSGMPQLKPNQFDDPYTNQLEGIAKAQMGEIRNNPALNQFNQIAQGQLGEIRNNPGLEQLKTFLNSQFQNLSQHPGFSPDEMAVLNTQAFEPIEELRKASQQRNKERTAQAGYLPSSGLAELRAGQTDYDYDKLRTVANRDLAVQAIDRRDQDLNRAQQIAMLLGQDIPQGQRSEELKLAKDLGITIPQGQRAEELQLANLLYQLPRNSLMDALAVVNGSPNSQNLMSGANLLAQQQYLQQQQNEQKWNAIAQFIAGLL